MKPLFALLVSAALIGCSSDDDDSSTELTGTLWRADDGAGCGFFLRLEEKGTYVRQRSCDAGVDTYENEIAAGSYRLLDGNKIKFTPTKYSCAGELPGATLTYSHDGDSLTLSDGSAESKFEAIDSSGDSDSIDVAIGCFDEDGNFEERPLLEIGTEEQMLPTALKDKVKLTYFGSDIYVSDKPFAVSCNEYMIDYMIDADHKECVGVSIATELEFPEAEETFTSWRITAADDTLLLNGIQPDGSEKITVRGVDYFCLLVEESPFDSEGNGFIGGQHIILSKSAVTKPSKLKSSDILAVGGDSDFCDALSTP